MTQPDSRTELETAVVAVYRGPLEEFISRRDALAKQLRASKDREAADRVKALRKPSRMAWILDSIVHEDPASIERLVAAIDGAQSAADLRTALDAIKAAVRDVAAVGAREAVRAGQPVEPSAVISAMHAVIGDASAFASLRAGLLVEVPEGGGLDMLAATVREQPRATTATPPTPDRKTSSSDQRAEATAQQAESEVREAEVTKAAAAKHAAATAKQKAELAKREAELARQRAERAQAARVDLRRAEVSLAELGAQSERALRSAQHAQERLDAAEHAVAQAQAEAEARRADLVRARDHVEVATADLRDAERAVAAARARVAEAEE